MKRREKERLNLEDKGIQGKDPPPLNYSLSWTMMVGFQLNVCVCVCVWMNRTTANEVDEPLLPTGTKVPGSLAFSCESIKRVSDIFERVPGMIIIRWGHLPR